MVIANYTVKHMTKDQLYLALELAKNEGWNPGIHDAECFYEVDSKGFFIGFLGEKPIATGSAVIYDDHYAFCGLYIVRPEYRGQGFGLELTKERLNYVGDRITGIDGVIENIEKYKKIGYVPAHKNIRYQYLAKSKFVPNSKIIPLKNIHLEELTEFDSRFFSASRKNFLKAWISQPSSFTKGYVDDSLRGYAVMRKCHIGYKIGPLFAETSDIASLLLESLSLEIPPLETIFIDIPEPNNNAHQLIKDFAMKPEFQVMRMYRNGFPDIDLKKIYGITTFEIG